MENTGNFRGWRIFIFPIDENNNKRVDNGFHIYNLKHKLSIALTKVIDINNKIKLKATIIKLGSKDDCIEDKTLSQIFKEENYKDIGTEFISLRKIADDIQAITDYGFLLRHDDIINIRKLIEDNFSSISKDRKTEADLEFEQGVMLIDEYIKANYLSNDEELKSAQNKGLCVQLDRGLSGRCFNIPVNKFAEIFKNSDFYKTDVYKLRKRLLYNELLYNNKESKRTDRLVKIDCKNIRVVSILESKLEQYIRECKEQSNTVN